MGDMSFISLQAVWRAPTRLFFDRPACPGRLVALVRSELTTDREHVAPKLVGAYYDMEHGQQEALVYASCIVPVSDEEKGRLFLGASAHVPGLDCGDWTEDDAAAFVRGLCALCHELEEEAEAEAQLLADEVAKAARSVREQNEKQEKEKHTKKKKTRRKEWRKVERARAQKELERLQRLLHVVGAELAEAPSSSQPSFPSSSTTGNAGGGSGVATAADEVRDGADGVRGVGLGCIVLSWVWGRRTERSRRRARALP